MSEHVAAVWSELKLPHGVKEDARIAPHILVRSSVFSTLEYAGAAQRPIIVRAAPLRLHAMSQYRVEQLEGPRLSQTDADLMFWMLSRAYRDGAPKDKAKVFFKRGEALTALGRSRGGKTDASLDGSLQRLHSAEFHFEERDKVTKAMMPLIQTRLLSRVEEVDDDAKHYDYRITIADGLAVLLENGSWVALSGKVRQELVGDPLAQGLYAHFASNDIVHPTWSETLRREMGREYMQTSKWGHALKRALIKVQAATGWAQCELLETGELAGKVVVRKGGVHGRRALKSMTRRTMESRLDAEQEIA